MYYHLHSRPIKNGMLSFFFSNHISHLMDFLVGMAGCAPGEGWACVVRPAALVRGRAIMGQLISNTENVDAILGLDVTISDVVEAWAWMSLSSCSVIYIIHFSAALSK